MAFYVTANASYPKVVVMTISAALAHTAAGWIAVIRISMLPEMLNRHWGFGCEVCFLLFGMSFCGFEILNFLIFFCCTENGCVDGLEFF